ncbi:MAG: hypothetical protein RLW68_17175 [Devosia marina]|uniref:hypothetical protein n=1 Tax=Devosia marina TaxID=2683198 RepID=UPI0032F05BF5
MNLKTRPEVTLAGVGLALSSGVTVRRDPLPDLVSLASSADAHDTTSPHSGFSARTP